MNSSEQVLFIDDDESIREFVTMALNDEGYDVLTAHNGAIGLETLRTATPGLILLDMRMPIMDGWTFLKRYMATPAPHVPVIALTASRSTTENNVPSEVSDFLAKPFELGELIEIVGRYLRPAHN